MHSTEMKRGGGYATGVPGILGSLDNVQQERPGQWMARCPAHADDRPSLAVALRGNVILLKCFGGCKTEDVLKSLGLTFPDLRGDARGERVLPPPRVTPPPIARDIVDRYRQRLVTQVRRYLATERHISEPVQREYMIGVDDEPRITIPVLDDRRRCVDIRRWLRPERRGEGSVKILSYGKGYGSAKLYPLEQTRYDDVIICEGELDALALISQGYHAVTSTAGAASWPSRFNSSFKKKTRILMDNDRPGAEGAALRQRGLDAKVITWPSRPDGWDVTDELREYGHMRHVI